MNNYSNIKEIHEKYNFPGSYRSGTLIQDNIVVRIYSNSVVANDYFSNNKRQFYYVLKSDKVMEAFKNTKKKNVSIFVFKRDLSNNKVIFYGMYKVKGFRYKKKYVLLEK
jgi:hypothetical protein